MIRSDCTAYADTVGTRQKNSIYLATCVRIVHPTFNIGFPTQIEQYTQIPRGREFRSSSSPPNTHKTSRKHRTLSKLSTRTRTETTKTKKTGWKGQTKQSQIPEMKERIELKTNNDNTTTTTTGRSGETGVQRPACPSSFPLSDRRPFCSLLP